MPASHAASSSTVHHPALLAAMRRYRSAAGAAGAAGPAAPAADLAAVSQEHDGVRLHQLDHETLLSIVDCLVHSRDLGAETAAATTLAARARASRAAARNVVHLRLSCRWAWRALAVHPAEAARLDLELQAQLHAHLGVRPELRLDDADDAADGGGQPATRQLVAEMRSYAHLAFLETCVKWDALHEMADQAAWLAKATRKRRNDQEQALELEADGGRRGLDVPREAHSVAATGLPTRTRRVDWLGLASAAQVLLIFAPSAADHVFLYCVGAEDHPSTPFQQRHWVEVVRAKPRAVWRGDDVEMDSPLAIDLLPHIVPHLSAPDPESPGIGPVRAAWALRAGAASADGSRLALLIDASAPVGGHARGACALVLTVRRPDAAGGGAFLPKASVGVQWIPLQGADACNGLGRVWWSGDALCHHVQYARDIGQGAPDGSHSLSVDVFVDLRAKGLGDGVRLAASSRDLHELAGLVMQRRPRAGAAGTYALCTGSRAPCPWTSGAWKVADTGYSCVDECHVDTAAFLACPDCAASHPFCCAACELVGERHSDHASLSMHTAPALDGSGCAMLFFPDLPIRGRRAHANQTAIVWLAEGHRGDADGSALFAEPPRPDDAWLEAHDRFDTPFPPPSPPSPPTGAVPAAAIAVDLTGGMMPACCTGRYLGMYTYELALGPRCQCLVAMQGRTMPTEPLFLPDARRQNFAARTRLRHTQFVTVFLPLRVPQYDDDDDDDDDDDGGGGGGGFYTDAADALRLWPRALRPRVPPTPGAVRYVPLVRLPMPDMGIAWPLPSESAMGGYHGLQATPLLQFSPCGRWVMLYGSVMDRGAHGAPGADGADDGAGLSVFDLGHWLRRVRVAGGRTQCGLLGIYYAAMRANPEGQRLSSYLGLSGLPHAVLVGGGSDHGVAEFRGVVWTRSGFWVVPRTGACLHLGARDMPPRPEDMPGR